MSHYMNRLCRSCCWHVVIYEFWRLGKTYPNTTIEDAPIPLPRLVLRCDHGEEAHVKQYRYPSMSARAYYCCRYTVVSIDFFFSIQLFIFSPLSCVNVIEISINFVESRPVQFFPVDWCTGDVEPTNSSISTWSKWVFFVSQLQALGSPATESTSSDRWEEGGSNYLTCQPPTFVQMRVPFWVGEPADRVELHTILALAYSIISNNS
jgi:hypothetical protein